MTNYQLVAAKDDEGNELGYYTREPEGISGMTVTALADFCGTDKTSISKLLTKIVQSDPLVNNLPDSLKSLAGKEMRLLVNDPQGRVIIREEVCYSLTEYYAFEARNYQGKQIAINNYRAIGRAGMRAFIWSKTGFTSPQPKPAHTTVYIQRLEHMKEHKIDNNHWCIFREAAEVLLMLEKEWRVPINDFDLLDGSIGKHWRRYRQGKSWARPTGTYTHKFRDRRDKRECNAYEYPELPEFRDWLQNEYIPNLLPKYLVDKYGKQATMLIYTEQNKLNDYILNITEIKQESPKQKQLFNEFLASRSELDLLNIA